jgi:hypothetical protein
VLTALGAAILVVALPAIAVGWALARECGVDDAARALGPIVGLAAVLLVLEIGTLAELGGWELAALPLVLGVVGAGVGIRRREQRFGLVPPALAAVACIAVMYVPFLRLGLGRQTVLGYDVSNDSAIHAVLARFVASGRAATVPGSTFDQVARVFYDTGYPRGSHELVAAAAAPAGGVFAAYDATMAVVIAFGAFAGYWLLRRAGAGPALSALGACLASIGYMQVAYYVEGFLPQMAATPFVFGALGLGFEAAAGARRVTALLAGAVAGAAVAVYSFGTMVFVVPGLVICALGSVLLAHERTARMREVAFQVALGALGGFLVLLPVLGPSVRFEQSSAGGVEARATTGNLLPGRPIDLKMVQGAWIAPDFRLPYGERALTRAAFVAAAVLLVAALAGALRRRRFALPVVTASVTIGAAVVARSSGPYYTAKAYQVLSFAVVCGVVAGAGLLFKKRTGPARVLLAGAGLALFAVWLVAVARSLEEEVRAATPAPAWLNELPALSNHLGDRLTLALLPGDWVKALLPQAVTPLAHVFVGASPPLRLGAGVAGFVDFDSFDTDASRRMEAIVEPRLGGFSIPPPPFRQARGTRSFRAWVRPASILPAAGRVPLERPGELGGRVLAPGGHAALPMSGERLLLGAEPATSLLSPLWGWQLTGSAWARLAGSPPQIASVGNGSGPATQRVDVAAPGRYRLSFAGAAVGSSISVDGHRVGTVPAGDRDGVEVVGDRLLRAGAHELALEAAPRPAYSSGLAVSLQQQDPRSAPVCIGTRHYEVAAGRPALIDARGRPVVVNCGHRSLRLDWVEPAGS